MFKQFTPTRRAIALTSEDIRSTWKRISEALKDTVRSVVKSHSSSRLERHDVPYGSHQAAQVHHGTSWYTRAEAQKATLQADSTRKTVLRMSVDGLAKETNQLLQAGAAKETKIDEVMELFSAARNGQRYQRLMQRSVLDDNG